MLQSSIYSIIKSESKTSEFQQIHYILSPGYGDDFDKMSIVDQVMHMHLDDIYTIFAWCYQSLSYVWLTIGLRPDINQGLQSHGHVMKNINKMPYDIIQLISLFIPESNYQKPRFHSNMIILASAINFIRISDGSRSLRYRI
jgi:hypothetical protein